MSRAVALTILLLLICTQGPLLLALRFHPAAGCAGAVLGLVVWTKLVRPMPGFIQGIVSLSGLAAILGVLVGCLARWLS